MPCGSVSPACSAMLQQFLRGKSASSPSRNPRARRRVSTRANRPAIRASNLSASACQPAGPTLSRPRPPRRNITIYGWSTSEASPLTAEPDGLVGMFAAAGWIIAALVVVVGVEAVMGVRVVTVNDVLDGHVALDIQCLDRIYLNAYVPRLQTSAQVVAFLSEHLGYPFPS